MRTTTSQRLSSPHRSALFALMSTGAAGAVVAYARSFAVGVTAVVVIGLIIAAIDVVAATAFVAALAITAGDLVPPIVSPVLVAVALAACASRRARNRIPTSIAVGAAAVIVPAAVSMLLSGPGDTRSLSVSQISALGAFVLPVLALRGDPGEVQKGTPRVRAILVGCILGSLAGSLSAVLGGGTSTYQIGQEAYDRFIGSYSDPNVLGSIAIGFLCVLLLSRRWIPVVSACVVACGFVWLAVASKSVSVIAGLAWLGVFVPFVVARGRSVRYKITAAVLLLTTGIVLAQLAQDSYFEGRLQIIGQELALHESRSFGTGRVRLWQAGASVAMANPVIGAGPVESRRQIARLAPYEHEYRAERAAHSTVIAVAAAHGVAAGIGVTILAIATARAIVTSNRLTALAIIPPMTVVFLFLDLERSKPFWLAMGIAFALARHRSDPHP